MNNVYVMKSDAGLVKIGMSHRPDERCKQLSGPLGANIEVAHIAASEHASMVERTAHILLQEHRKIGEWFDVSVEEAVAAIETAISIVSDRDKYADSNVQARRKALNLSQKQFAAICGLWQTTVSRIENGKDNVPGYVDMILALLERDESAVRFAMERSGLL